MKKVIKKICMICICLFCIMCQTLNNNIYAYSIVTILMIMTIFTGEWTTIMTSITTLLALLIYKLIKKIIMKKKEKEPIPIGFFLAFTNILYMIIFMLLLRNS